MKNNLATVPYQGSKAKLLTFIEMSLEHYFKRIETKREVNTFFDAFSGSGQIAYHFKDKYNIISNDKQAFTKVINDTYLNSKSDVVRIRKLIDELNNLPLTYFYKTDGWFTKTYSQDFLDGSAVSSDGSRKVWLTKNAQKIDMIRTRIDEMYEACEIVDDEKNILLTALLRAANLVANTLGHQNSYLKKWSDKALKDLVLNVPNITQSKRAHQNICGDIFDVLDDIESDIVYFDPPYGSNNAKGSAFSYSAFYHLNNTLVLNARPETFGKASRPLNTKAAKNSLEKNKKEIVIPEFVDLIQRSKTQFVCFSYSTQGLLSIDDFEKVFDLGGCDMDTFKVYYTQHKKNKQSQTALKLGHSISRDNHSDELFELLIIARKKTVFEVDGETNDKINNYLSNANCHKKVTDKGYSTYFDNAEKTFSDEDFNKAA